MPNPNEIEDTEELDLQRPETDEVEPGAQASGETSADAASSPATDVSKPDGEDTLSIVRDVVDKRAADPAAASSANGEEAGDQSAGGQPTTTDGTDDYSDVPFNKHPRFQALLRERKEFETDAVRYRNVQNFLDAEGLTGEDAAHGLTLLARSRNEGLTGPEMADGLAKLALIKRDPVAGLEAIRPFLQGVLVAAGAVLPDDLRNRVQAGELSQEAAAELSRQRAQIQTHEAQRVYDQQRVQSRQQADASKALSAAADEWERDRWEKDPGFEAKLPKVKDEVKRLQSLGWVPTNAEGVKEQLRRAYASVNGALRPAAAAAPAQRAPAPRPALRPVMGGQVAGNTSAAPESTLDHVNLVLAKRRAG